jgi:RNA polymerase sigma-70 factor (ECF subfamily)
MSAGHPTERDFRALLRRARSGDESAWRALYEWLSPQLLGYLRAGRLSDADDVVGEVWLEVARRIGDFSGDASGFRSWVFTIARSRRVDEIRRRLRRRDEPLGPMAQGIVSPQDVEREAITVIEVGDMLELFGMLTHEQSEVLALRVFAGLTSREIGEITGRSTGAVEQLQHRALSSLREHLGDRKETGGANGDSS